MVGKYYKILHDYKIKRPAVQWMVPRAYGVRCVRISAPLRAPTKLIKIPNVFTIAITGGEETGGKTASERAA